MAAGAVAAATTGRRSRAGAVAGATCITAAAILGRWSVFKAGFQSAGDPRATVEPQRADLAAKGDPA
jgi:hypothetical protein